MAGLGSGRRGRRRGGAELRAGASAEDRWLGLSRGICLGGEAARRPEQQPRQQQESLQQQQQKPEVAEKRLVVRACPAPPE